MLKVLSLIWSKLFVSMQRLAQSLLLPLAVLSFTVLLSALGNHIALFRAIEAYVYVYLPVVFTIGIASGFARKNKSWASVYAVLLYLVGEGILITLNTNISGDLFFGILCGVFAAVIHNGVGAIENYKVISFLRGPKAEAIVIILGGVVLGILAGPVIESFGQFGAVVGEIVNGHASLSAFIYGVLNRLLVPFGIHHLLNSFVGVQVGVYGNEQGEFMRFILGDPTAGRLTGGLYSIAMFGLPAAAFASFLAAKKGERKQIGKVIFPAVLASVVTGVTEPLEYLLIFSSPILYLIHILFSGIAFFLTSYFGVRIIYSYSAGIFDYAVNGVAGTNAYRILYIGMAMFIAYFIVFYFVAKNFKLLFSVPLNEQKPSQKSIELGFARRNQQEQMRALANAYVEALGGPQNIEELRTCTTRIRLVVNNAELVDEEVVMELGALGVSKMAGNYIQIVVGQGLEILAKEIREILKESENEKKETNYLIIKSPAEGRVVLLSDLTDEAFKNKMIGDGIAIEPTDGDFVAPFDGKIVQIAPTKHSIIIQGPGGIAILIHMGIDTVYLEGRVFDCFVEEGQEIKSGELLVRMNLDEVVTQGKSTISPVIVVNDESTKTNVKPISADFVKRQDPLLTIKW